MKTSRIRNLLIGACMAGLVVRAMFTPAAAEQKYVAPIEGCLSEFYDSQYYNWLSYRNNCSQSVSVTFVSRFSSGIFGSVTISPGGKKNTGWSREEINRAGGLTAFACPDGYHATGENGSELRHGATLATCRED